ncbi:MAG: DPP IV N-terminal domain-containing protein, partial [Planctomycetales bacterium]|nr:DPP IV N-terminal domain-containing protein [Planctomycetales bacterium]
MKKRLLCLRAVACIGLALTVQVGPALSADPPRVENLNLRVNWIGDGHFWYRKARDGQEHEFILVDSAAAALSPAFDHHRLAESLSAQIDRPIDAFRMPFEQIDFSPDREVVRFDVDETAFAFNRQSGVCWKLEGEASGGQPSSADDAVSGRNRDGRRGRRRWRQFQAQGGRSPDGKWEAEVRDGNVYVKPLDQTGEERQLTSDGTAEVGYSLLSWAPNSLTLAAFRVTPGDNREVHLIESSPKSGGRAVLRSRGYPLPGDRLPSYELSLFDVVEGRQIRPDVEPLDLEWPRLSWREDGRRAVYQKVDRGHQRFRVMSIDSQSGAAATLIDEATETFIWTVHTENLDLQLVNWLDHSEEIVYVSEQDGWRRLYLANGQTPEELKPITPSGLVVRGIDGIDEAKRQVWFHACGGYADQDPYFLHFYRVNFDGSGLTPLTVANGNHAVQFSPDRRYFVDSYSRVDLPTVHELRSADDGRLVCELERADDSALRESGWRPPQVFVAKGRDGQTDIWGLIHRPRDLDPSQKYPVVESIYAGPQGAFVPKSYSPYNRFRDLNERGFIVVQIDGMGTANRSKAFHDVCWHNLKDGGFLDRIAWMKAAAKVHPELDLERVGIFGGSAGGQNAAAAVLFHPDFYDVAVAGCGCHDNRMDKIWWN